MLNTFLTNTCNITRYTIVNDNGVDKKTSTVVYTGIVCQIYNTSSNLSDTNVAVNTPENTWSILLEPTKNSVKIGDIVVVNDPDLGNIGTFQINNIKMNRFVAGNDSIYLKVTAI